jgi:hypothetical protein
MKDQRVVALAKANAIRGKRATLKKELFALPLEESRRRAAELLLRPPEWLGTMPVFTLLTSCRRTGPAFARRFLRPVGISDRRSLGSLTEREAEHLALLLRTDARGKVAA